MNEKQYKDLLDDIQVNKSFKNNLIEQLSKQQSNNFLPGKTKYTHRTILKYCAITCSLILCISTVLIIKLNNRQISTNNKNGSNPYIYSNELIEIPIAPYNIDGYQISYKQIGMDTTNTPMLDSYLENKFKHACTVSGNNLISSRTNDEKSFEQVKEYIGSSSDILFSSLANFTNASSAISCSTMHDANGKLEAVNLNQEYGSNCLLNLYITDDIHTLESTEIQQVLESITSLDTNSEIKNNTITMTYAYRQRSFKAEKIPEEQFTYYYSIPFHDKTMLLSFQTNFTKLNSDESYVDAKNIPQDECRTIFNNILLSFLK